MKKSRALLLWLYVSLVSGVVAFFLYTPRHVKDDVTNIVAVVAPDVKAVDVEGARFRSNSPDGVDSKVTILTDGKTKEEIIEMYFRGVSYKFNFNANSMMGFFFLAEKLNRYAREPNKNALFELARSGDTQAQTMLIARLKIYSEVNQGTMSPYLNKILGEDIKRHPLFDRDFYKDFYQISAQQAQSELQEAHLIAAAYGNVDSLSGAASYDNSDSDLHPALVGYLVAEMDKDISSATFLKLMDIPAGSEEKYREKAAAVYQQVIAKRLELGLEKQPNWRQLALDWAAKTPCFNKTHLRLIDEDCKLPPDDADAYYSADMKPH